MRRRWRCEVEEEYLDPWTSEEGRCGGDGDGGGVAFLREQDAVDLFSSHPPRPNPQMQPTPPQPVSL